MIRRRQINARRKAPRLRSLGARVGERFRDVAMAVEERVGWPLADRLRAAGEVARWPFERATWTTERRVVWPLGERAARHGLSGSSLAVGAALLATCAVAAVAIVVGGRSGGEAPTVAETPASAPAGQPTPNATKPAAPVLHGAAPDFTPEGGDAGAKVANRETVIASKAGAGAASSASPAGPVATPSSVGQTAKDPGPAAIDVARRFSGAFVLYETGDDGADVRAAFDATASPRLTQALLRRPPRLPANVKVPKAKVLNVVPGPRHGDTFTLSASLLRVGVTSELRIDVQRDDASGEWQVTDVLG
ncbi:MAG TPA: hypothetical protein VF245_12080 [Solirubrobacterales bacterium]